MSDPYVCPDCGRDKALTIQDAVAGKCPKWWAVRDRHADLDCSNFKERKGAYENYREPGEFGEGATVRRVELEADDWRLGKALAGYETVMDGSNEVILRFLSENEFRFFTEAMSAGVVGVGLSSVQYVEALRKIAAYDDAAANAYLRATGSYRCFDEPGAVELARGVLDGKTDV